MKDDTTIFTDEPLLGRRSFGGFNQTIEKMNSQLFNKQKSEENEEETPKTQSADVSDTQMAMTFEKQVFNSRSSVYGKQRGLGSKKRKDFSALLDEENVKKNKKNNQK